MKHNLLLLLCCASLFFPNYISAQKLALTPFASGFSKPMDIKNCGDNRLFVAERAGQIKVVTSTGAVLPAPMLDISAKVSSVSCEEGFLGFAFSPAHKTDRKLYVNYTSVIAGQLTSVIEEYKVSSTDTNLVDPASAITLLTVAQPYCNHNGGNMMFGKDGYLYIFFGDGGSGGDPNNNAQNKTTVLGKILRVDISSSSPAQPYLIPSSNPFFNDNTPGLRKEIWAYGLRNPFRGSVDRITGDIWIGDVGQSAREEIDFHPYTAASGVNYGWRTMEGNICYNPSSGCNTAGLQLPIYDYPRANGYSVIVGYVHRSVQSNYKFGMYLFSDYGTKWIDGFRQVNGAISGAVERLLPGTLAPGGPVGYGEDMYGDLYICYENIPSVYKISDTSYVRRPKAFIQSTQQAGSEFILRGLTGRNVSYQWLKNGNPIQGATSPDYTTNGGGTYQLEITNDLNRKDTSDPFSLSVLPIAIKDFVARRTGHEVVLSWSTLYEQNNTGFGIERRAEGESDFREIAFMSSQSNGGNSSVLQNYNYLDAGVPAKGNLYYRIRYQQSNNQIFYTEIRSVRADNGYGYTIFPNPAKDHVVIYLTEFNNQKLDLKLYDVQGKLIRTEVINSSPFRLSLTGVKGVYLINILDGRNSKGVQKLIVE